MTSEPAWPPSPWPLAWHPETTGDFPDPARFVVPSCGGGMRRTQGGLWTSPMVTDRYSAWSIQHDKAKSSVNLVREGWALQWPDRCRTAVIDSHDDLCALVRDYPCTEHVTVEQWMRRGFPPDLDLHDTKMWPALDFGKMTTDFDAVYLSETGRRATWMEDPGTSLWDVETVLWLAPTWTRLHPITTDAFAGSAFLDALARWLAVQVGQPGP